jgi:hypothetical protein
MRCPVTYGCSSGGPTVLAPERKLLLPSLPLSRGRSETAAELQAETVVGKNPVWRYPSGRLPPGE